MKTAIELLKDVPTIIADKHLELNRLSHFLLLTIGYAPDRDKRESIGDLLNGDESFIKMSNEILDALGNKFLEELYVDRIERFKVEGYIPSNKPIILYGLTGVGKTVLVLKVCDSINKSGFAHCNYFDFRSINNEFIKITGRSVVESIHEIIYHVLFKENVEGSEDAINNWIRYKILEDSRFVTIKELILDSWRKPLTGYQWLEKLDTDPLVMSEYAKIDHFPNLVTLLRYLTSKQQLVLCFDNVDRFPLEQQRKILDSCIHLSNAAHVTIIITLRTANLRRLTAEGARGDIVFMDRINAIPAESVEINKLIGMEAVDGIDDVLKSIRSANEQRREDVRETLVELLNKRFAFIRKNESYIDFGKYYKDLNEKHGWNYRPSEYINRFWQIFHAISKSFAEEDLYQHCNYSIREILVLLFDFINKLIIEPEPNYTFEKLFPHTNDARITILRNYLYKWLLCSGESIPEKDGVIPNIFKQNESESRMLYMKILSYLHERQHGPDGIPFQQIFQDFWGFGIDRAELRNAVRYLAKDQQYKGRVLIWIDQDEDKPLDDAKILIMPAGRYFIDRLSISRDYVFWMLLQTEFSDEDIKIIFGKGKIDYALTYDDGYRTEIVYRFLENKLVPAFSNEINTLDASFYRPVDWDRTSIEYFKSMFSVKGKCYAERLTDSILNSIDFATIEPDQKREIKGKYNLLHKKIIQLVKEAESKK